MLRLCLQSSCPYFSIATIFYDYCFPNVNHHAATCYLIQISFLIVAFIYLNFNCLLLLMNHLLFQSYIIHRYCWSYLVPIKLLYVTTSLPFISSCYILFFWFLHVVVTYIFSIPINNCLLLVAALFVVLRCSSPVGLFRSLNSVVLSKVKEISS